MTTDFSETQARQQADARWERDVRDPAGRNSEGCRVLCVPGADAEYEIAPLDDGRWALKMSLQYGCGHCHGAALPWQAYGTRDECVALFLARARRHFGLELTGGSVTDEQRTARQAMLGLLDHMGVSVASLGDSTGRLEQLSDLSS